MCISVCVPGVQARVLGAWPRKFEIRASLKEEHAKTGAGIGTLADEHSCSSSLRVLRHARFSLLLPSCPSSFDSCSSTTRSSAQRLRVRVRRKPLWRGLDHGAAGPQLGRATAEQLDSAPCHRHRRSSHGTGVPSGRVRARQAVGGGGRAAAARGGARAGGRAPGAPAAPAHQARGRRSAQGAGARGQDDAGHQHALWRRFVVRVLAWRGSRRAAARSGGHAMRCWCTAHCRHKYTTVGGMPAFGMLYTKTSVRACADLL